MAPTAANFKLPAIYSWFFLIIEPISALVGAYFAHFQQHEYLQMTHVASSPLDTTSIPLSTSIVLSQLANLYLLFAINEAVSLFFSLFFSASFSFTGAVSSETGTLEQMVVARCHMLSFFGAVV